jgi:hypothetical protein
MRRSIVILVVAAWMTLAPRASHAWNRTGHRAIALIAYNQLDEGTRQKIAVLLRKNPIAYDRWEERRTNSDRDPAADAFMNAATFPDDVRAPSQFAREFHHSKHHYVSFRYDPREPNRTIVEPPADEENILTSYRKYIETVKGTKAGIADTDKAVALAWIFHQEGDIHMPLHAIARFSATFPEGDHGGNLVTPFPNPRGSRPWSKNLHGYWDDMLGDDDRVTSFARLDEAVAVLVSEYPRKSFSDAELKQDDIRAWALESAELCKSTVYKNLDPDIKGFAALPVAYEAEAQLVARRRIALAGYRLAEVLKDLFGDAND